MSWYAVSSGPVMMQFTINVMIQYAWMVPMALAIVMLYRLDGYVNFALSATAMLSGVVATTAVASARGPIAAVVVGIAVALAVGLAVRRLVLVPLLKIGATAPLLMVATIGLDTAVRNIIVMGSGENMRVVSSDPGHVILPFQDARISCAQIAAVALGIMAASTVLMVDGRTLVGTWARAMSEGVETACCLGVRPIAVVRYATVTAFCLGAIAGSVRLLDVGANPRLGPDAFASGLGAAIWGGASLRHAAVAAAVLAIARELAIRTFPIQWQPAISYGIVGIALLVTSFQRQPA